MITVRLFKVFQSAPFIVNTDGKTFEPFVELKLRIGSDTKSEAKSEVMAGIFNASHSFIRVSARFFRRQKKVETPIIKRQQKSSPFEFMVVEFD